MEQELPEDRPSEVEDAFADAFAFEQIIQASNWQAPGDYYRQMPVATRRAVEQVVAGDEGIRRELREDFFPQLLRQGGLIDWKQADADYINLLQRKCLYTGDVIAADGTLARYETLSLLGAQIAISKVSYQGSTAQIVSNMMHWGKELPRKVTAADIVAALRSRGQGLKEKLNNIFLYTLMTYKEREVLLDSPPGTFKLIQGTVFPYEMLSGSGTARTMVICLDLLAEMITDGNYATIVSSSSDRDLYSFGLALDAGEYLIVRSGKDVLDRYLYTDEAEQHYRANYSNVKMQEYGNRSQLEVFKEFRDRYGSQVVQGILRAHQMSPPYIFFCNADRVDEAVHMLLADAAHTGPRGFPLLVDLADQYCSGGFKASEYLAHMNAEFVRASGGSGMYQSERATRD